MDPIKILKRAWNIVWNYRTLWIFGFILALTASGGLGGGGNNGSRFNINGNDRESMHQFDGFHLDGMDRQFKDAGEFFEYFKEYGIPQIERQLQLAQGDLTTMFWIVIAFVGIMFLFGLVMAAIRYTTETSVIRMVGEYDASETKYAFREGWRKGWNRRAWKLFLIDIIVNLPMIAFLLTSLLIGIAILIRANSMNLMGDGHPAVFLLGGAILLGVFLLVLLITIFLNLLKRFFWRKAALEEFGVRDSLREGWQLVKENRKNVGLMWLVMVGIGFAWGIASILLAIVALPVVVITVIIAVVISAIPAALFAAFFSLFLSAYLPWIAGGLFVLPLFFIVAFSPWIFLAGVWQTYTSTVWTLVYRELINPPAIAEDMAALTPDDEPEFFEAND